MASAGVSRITPQDSRRKSPKRKQERMFRAIGVLIILWGFSQFFSSSFTALDSAATESFKALEAAAVVTQNELER